MKNIFEEDKKFEPAPEGAQPARLVWLVDLGTHPDTYEGVTRYKHGIYLGFELVGTHMEDGRPFLLGKTYNATNGLYGPYAAKTSNLCAMLKKWQGCDDKTASKLNFIGKLAKIGAPAIVTVEHTPKRTDPTKINVNIESIKAYKGKETLLEPVNPVMIYSLGMDYPETMPQWMKLQIESCCEFNGGIPERERSEEPLPEPPPNGPSKAFDDDIPF